MNATAYADTSLLASLYLADANTPAALAAVSAAGAPLLLTSWQQFELENAFQLRLFRREATRADLAASFQKAVIEILVGKTLRAAREFGRDAIALSGGVSLNRALRDAFEIACEKQGIELMTATPALCTDNAAMIAFAAWSEPDRPADVAPAPSLTVDQA